MKNQVCLNCATAGISQQIASDRCTCCGTVAPATIEPREFWETQDQFRARAFEVWETLNDAASEATEEVCEPCNVKVIRRFYAICQSVRVDVKNADVMRGALSAFFGRKILSRRELTTDMWLSAGDAIEAGRLVF